jgi:hypothetical protein
MDLGEVFPLLAQGRANEMLPPVLPDPWGVVGEPCPKPVAASS